MKLMISGGGTGGHIYPALAIIEDLIKKEPKSQVLYIGSTRGLEKNIVPKYGIPFKELKIQGFKRSLSPTNIKTVYLFLRSVGKSFRLIHRFKPDIVVGTGGYVSGAVVFAAHLMHIPTMIQEQNSIVGLTNRFLGRFVDRVAITFPNVKSKFPHQKVVITGNPRAQQVAEHKSNFRWSQLGLSDKKPVVLIFGGSQGALKLNQSFIGAIDEFNRANYQIVFATGQKRYASVKHQLAGRMINKNIVIKPYLHHIADMLPHVSLIVSRAGATSLAEIAALDIPSILIPSPYVTANHQMKNAKYFTNHGAAKLLTEKQLNHTTLVKDINALINNPKKLVQMSKATEDLGTPQAADTFLNEMMSVITDKTLSHG